MTFLPIAILGVLFVSGMPIAIALILSIIPYFLLGDVGIPADFIIQKMITTTENNTMLAIPFFIAAGAMMNRSGITPRLMRFATLLVGHVRGGLAQVNVLLSALMGGISGSGAADAASDCKILVPEMIKHGYSKPFCAAVTAASCLITPIIPPGIGLVLYGFVTGTSIGRLFLAGYIPGILLTVLMMLLVDFISKKNNYGREREKRATVKELAVELKDSIWALMLPVLLVVCMRTGIFTATEGGAILVLYAFIVGKFVYKEIKLKDIPSVFLEAMLGACTVMLVMCAANAFAFYLSWERLPHALSTVLATVTSNKFVFLLILNLLLIGLGMFMEVSSAIVILVPLLMPAIEAMGIDMVHLGIIMVFNMCIGSITPPFGTVIYLVGPLLKISVEDFTKALLPFIGLMLFMLFLITYVPQLSVFLPNLVYGP
ncbi:MAG: TRAP transporter large permease [Clostridia bacterium]